ELPARRDQTHPCFNEAEADKPRMLKDGDHVLVSCCGFNEAEADKPRMPRLVEPCLDGFRASMRPRQISLGCTGSGVGRGYPSLASMRPRQISLGCDGTRLRSSGSRTWRFNEAEADKPRMPWISSTNTTALELLQ